MLLSFLTPIISLGIMLGAEVGKDVSGDVVSAVWTGV